MVSREAPESGRSLRANGGFFICPGLADSHVTLLEGCSNPGMAIQSSEEKQKSLSGDKLLRFFGDSRNFQERKNLRGSSLVILSLSLARLLKKLLVPRFSCFLPLRFLGGHFRLKVLKAGRH